MERSKLLFFLLFLFFFISCTESHFEELSENNVDPEITKPVAKSFVIENAIKIEWDKDIGADEYILYRDKNPEGSFSDKIYGGTNLSYTDDDVTDGNFYYYKLAKKRGKKEFDKSKYVYGYASNIKNDLFEENNKKKDAKLFEDDVTANIYYYKDNNGNELLDNDWYYVELIGKKMMVVEFEFVQNSLNNGDIKFIQEGYAGISISDFDTVSIRNDSHDKKNIYFQITAEKSQFIGLGNLSGGKLGFYKINFVQIVDLN